MQSIGKLSAAAAGYYTDQLTHSVGEDVPVQRDGMDRQVDYYAAHQSPSRWMGSGLERIDLQTGSAVDKGVFEQLMHHVSPAGEAMAVARTHGRVAAFDHTFSAPKSVSLLYAYGNPEIRRSVVEAHHQAVAAGVDYMQDQCAKSRLGVRYRDEDGTPRFTTRTLESEGYVAAGFDHFTSRADDPQLHTHVVVINRVWAGDGWRALDGKLAYAHAKAGGTVYQAALRDHLTRSLGVDWKPVANGMAEIDGFTPELLEHFSTRRTEIQQAVDRYLARHGGEAHTRMYQKFTLETRQPKTQPAGEAAATREMKDYGVGPDVVAHWNHKANTAPQHPAEVIAQVIGAERLGIRPDPAAVEAAAKTVTERVTDRQAVFTERDLIAHVAALYPDGATRPELTDATRLLLDTAKNTGDVLTILPASATGIRLPDGIRLDPDELATVLDRRPSWIEHVNGVRFRALPGEPRFTTRLQLEREAAVLAAVATPSPVGADPATLEASIAARGLTNEQATAVRRLADLDGRLVAMTGPGGSGKTYSIAAYADAGRAAGHHVIGVATSASAARKLADDLPPDVWTGTIAMLQHHLQTGPGLPDGSVIVVDEASTVSTRDLAWLVRQTDRSDGQLVLLGDPMQLPSIDSGGLFHRIAAGDTGVVTDLAGVNQRQLNDFDRTLLQRLREGEARGVVHDYSEAGRLHLGRDEYATKTTMVDTWHDDVTRHGLDQVRMLASRHDEVAMLNQLARTRINAEGHLTGPAVVNRWGQEFQTGDRIVVRDNWYGHSDLRNGQTGTVIRTNPTTGSLTFQRDGDQVEIELPRRYVDRDVDHAYAQTIHTAQGQTYHTTHLFADTGVASEHAYTALSRARDETHLWVADVAGPLGECTHIHGQPLVEDRIDALVRQLTRSVIEPPATDHGLHVHTATDRQLIDWRDDLARTLYNSPLNRDPSDQLVALDAAITDARAMAQRLGTGTHQVASLENQRQHLLDQIEARRMWIDDNAELIHRYTAVTDEIHHRISARVALYEINPPEDLLQAFGQKPTDVVGERRWLAAAAAHAEARLEVGEHLDLHDPAIFQARRWRAALGPAELVDTAPHLRFGS